METPLLLTLHWTHDAPKRSPQSCVGRGCPAGVEPGASTFTESRARPLHYGHRMELRIGDCGFRSSIRNPKSAIPIARPGLEPGTPRSKRGMMSVSPSSRERVESGESRVESQKPRGRPAFSDSRLWTLDSRLSGSPTRTRTRNSSLEARNDVRFTIGPWKSRELRVESPEPENSSGSQPWTLSPRPFPAEGMGFEPTRPRGRTV